MRREAAPSSARGGAVSTQLARLMRECQCRLHADDAAPFQRTQRPPPGIDAVLCADDSTPLGGATVVQQVKGSRGRGGACGHLNNRFCIPAVSAPVRERHVVVCRGDDEAEEVRVVIATPPEWVRDNHGLRWRVASANVCLTAESMWQRRLSVLGSAGALASINFVIFKERPRVISHKIRDAPLGPMSDALRSAVPVCAASAAQSAQTSALFAPSPTDSHPHLLSPLSYSLELESAVALLWEFSPGGTLRTLLWRYAHTAAHVLAGFGQDMMSGLVCLHKRGVAHGSLHLDNVMIDANGRCRLVGHFWNGAAARALFILPQVCYVSPAMAAGVPPTPACDMFCYGLLLLEAMTRQPCWRWATAEEYAGHAAPHAPPSAKALADLMAGGGRAFSNAVAQGRVVAHVELLGAAAAVERHEAELRDAVCRLLSPDVAARPTAEEMREIVMASLTRGGLVVAETE
ncbi:Protein tyrosine kinase/Protein kinase domain containing protein [Novymonas esmeraldas]|uniref:Protein tyrosine kinase/Protein kinase domain containing protein n=1 Tax=Novymonas esmeraldas TaxID=1808958 RepID=A0AAW0F0D8_9TRYP